MKPVLEKVSSSINASFNYELVEESCFYTMWHYHPEFEIIFMLEGTGTGFVGDGFFNFGPGTLSLIGENVPHVWLNEKKYYEKGAGLLARSIVIKFRKDFLGSNFFEIPEMVKIRKLFSNSARGMIFKGKTRSLVSEMVAGIIEEQDPEERLFRLLKILKLMSVDPDPGYISNRPYYEKGNSQDIDRIDRIYKFLMSHYTRKIELSEVAGIASLSPTAFCRYFKSRTNKTFSQFLNEIRIGHACKLLIERDLSISEVCYHSGFNYPSNFHKQFKKIKGITPQAYQARYLATSRRELYTHESPVDA
ncbi:MAG: AraC family transcriptional regulator [Bacteroidota bacterium]